MPWNPELYDQFKKERSAPFFDLTKLVEVKANMSVIDLGCGTGELTSSLLALLPDSQILGIDSSKEMLEKARSFENDRLHFVQRTVEEQLAVNDSFDLIIANASLQWCQNHPVLLPEIISKLNSGGQLAIQVPSNHDFIVHRLLSHIAQREVYETEFKGWRRQYSVLKIEDYASILYQNNGKNINVFEKIYPHVLENADAIYEWATGTAIIPFLERLPDHLKTSFKNDYQSELRKVFPESPVFYPFKRTFIYAQF